jgi:prephenate dehydrogenase
MGGSLALALRGKVASLVGIDPDPAARRLAMERQVVDQVAGQPARLLSQASLVILAAPVRAILSTLADLPGLHPGDAVVIDLGSTKVEIARAMTALPPRLSPVGGHPLCGKAVGGLENAEAGLFQAAPFFLSRLPNSSDHACRLAEALTQAVGGEPGWIDPATHDRLIARTSHLPYLAANALARCTPLEAAPLAGPGFRSTTRLASTPLQMMADILLTNTANILESLRDYRLQLQALEDALEVGDFERLQTLLEQGAQRHEELTAGEDRPGRAGSAPPTP